MDYYWHMNNAQYFRVTELIRWRCLLRDEILSTCVKNRWSMLVVRQDIKYLRPIPAFEKYSVLCTLNLSDNEKYLCYKYTFQQHVDAVKLGNEPNIFAMMNTTAVIKEISGKTVRPSQLNAHRDVIKPTTEKDNSNDSI